MAKAAGSQGPSTIEQLTDWVLAQRTQDISAAAVNQAKILLLDTIGCGYAAYEEEAAHAVLATLKELGGAPQCTVIGSATKTNAPNAVLVNGSLIRILDLNDYVNTKSGQIGGHPSDNIPVALAGAQPLGPAGGEVIPANLVGDENFRPPQGIMEPHKHSCGVTRSLFTSAAPC